MKKNSLLFITILLLALFYLGNTQENEQNNQPQTNQEHIQTNH